LRLREAGSNTDLLEGKMPEWLARGRIGFPDGPPEVQALRTALEFVAPLGVKRGRRTQ
jgi:hypothetical protein